jgi:hypothetical protein
MSKAAIILAAGAPEHFFGWLAFSVLSPVSDRKNATKKIKGARDE